MWWSARSGGLRSSGFFEGPFLSLASPLETCELTRHAVKITTAAEGGRKGLGRRDWLEIRREHSCEAFITRRSPPRTNLLDSRLSPILAEQRNRYCRLTGYAASSHADSTNLSPARARKYLPVSTPSSISRTCSGVHTVTAPTSPSSTSTVSPAALSCVAKRIQH